LYSIVYFRQHKSAKSLQNGLDSIAQRIDLLVTIPKAGGAFPIIAQ